MHHLIVMMTAKQICLLFGFFLSMFYIFKFGNVSSARQDQLCKELETLQIANLSEIIPLIRSNTSDPDFETKLNKASQSLKDSPDYILRQKQAWQIKGRLSGHTCPASSFAQMARLALEG